MSKIEDEKYMQQCLTLAESAIGNTYPNPMVGCVIVHNNKIIGSGYHHKAGEPHAEVNAISSVSNQNLLSESTLYVNLEPCAHFGKTPPCADLIVSKQIHRVVIGCVDSFNKVSGKGIEKLKNAGIPTTVGILEEQSRFLNRRFFTFHEKHRPYIILKWAQTNDGFIDKCSESKESTKGVKITNDECSKVVHKWRTQEQAILVGKTTALNDNPRLTARMAEGKNPLRLVIDLQDSLPENLYLKDGSCPTVIFTSTDKHSQPNLEYCKIDSSQNIINEILDYLYQNNIQSLIVEGGTKTLQSFIDANLWDEFRYFTTNDNFGIGIKAPKFPFKESKTENIGNALLRIGYSQNNDI